MTFVTCRPSLNQYFDNNFLAFDVVEEKNQYVFKADLPGIKKEDIKVSLEDNILTVSAERKSETETEDKEYHRIERSFGRYQRSFNLANSSVDASKIQASYKDGVLELTVPKSENAKPKSIDVQVN